MRLSSHQITTIKTTVEAAWGSGAHVTLFGSRVHDKRKGGDINLFLEPTQMLTLKEQLQLQYQLMSACDIKIDLVVKNPEKLETLFFGLARKRVRLT